LQLHFHHPKEWSPWRGRHAQPQRPPPVLPSHGYDPTGPMPSSPQHTTQSTFSLVLHPQSPHYDQGQRYHGPTTNGRWRQHPRHWPRPFRNQCTITPRRRRYGSPLWQSRPQPHSASRTMALGLHATISPSTGSAHHEAIRESNVQQWNLRFLANRNRSHQAQRTLEANNKFTTFTTTTTTTTHIYDNYPTLYISRAANNPAAESTTLSTQSTPTLCSHPSTLGVTWTAAAGGGGQSRTLVKF